MCVRPQKIGKPIIMIAFKGNQIANLEQDLHTFKHFIMPVYDIAELNQ